MSDEELKKRWLEVYPEAEFDENANRDELIAAIISGTEEIPGPRGIVNEEDEEDEVFGDLDEDQEHAIPKGITSQENWQDNVVVWQVPTRVVEGELVELKGQGIVQSYEPEMYKRLVKQKFFSESKLRMKVLNRP